MFCGAPEAPAAAPMSMPLVIAARCPLLYTLDLSDLKPN